jgi:hypothetical protein
MLPVVLAILGLIPVLTGGLDLILGARSLHVAGSSIPFDTMNDVVLDSQIRFFAATWLGVGIILYWMIPSIDRQTTLFRLLMGGIFLGGVGRISSAALVGIPPVHFIAAIVLELVGVPILVLWQSALSKPNGLTEPLVVHDTLQ